jgi:cell wall-associated NlpC family hydrolase
MSILAAAIVRVARSKVGSQVWLYAREKGDFGKNTNKCNLFVSDVLIEAGVKPPPVVPKYVVLRRPPTAGEWADPAVKIEGWRVVTEPQPGDVVAEAHNYSDATGHVGIVVGERQTVSASALVGGVIVQNDWGFRKENKPTFRRYTR